MARGKSKRNSLKLDSSQREYDKFTHIRSKWLRESPDTIADRRRWTPYPTAKVLLNDGTPVSYEVYRNRDPRRDRRQPLPYRIQFNDPRRVMICRRRRARRAVLFAMDKLGRGRGGPGRARKRLNEFSKIKC